MFEFGGDLGDFVGLGLILLVISEICIDFGGDCCDFADCGGDVGGNDGGEEKDGGSGGSEDEA